MGEKEISQAVISRLPRYYRYLGMLKDKKVERISSRELSQMMNVTASQIRQDLNNFGGFGHQGYGYNVELLYSEIANILGLSRQHNLILVGAGNLGKALAGYVNFERRGFYMRGIFDIDPFLYGKKIRDIPIMPIDEIEDFIKNNEIDIAVICIPATASTKVVERIVACGIKAIWNFSHVDLDVSDDVSVENVHLSDSLMRLSYAMKSKRDRQESKGN
ncbi:MAG: redox-sensing transcriptional repressor Rex [Lachnospiraceae bacterium]|nr:redox-sensing transcriptional repressor Rex [Lachnospiraceae bacterium]MBR0147631.1 redox-sensing transcriptional repressor Rex [Lachnospiraceae bacterium]MBR4174167.1 redox-sensing transcriptional repressor Rex [Lachnospiraceae bacterium]